MTVTKTSVLVLFTALFALSSAFSPSLLTERARLSQRTKTAISYYSNESALDSADAAEPLPLTVDDLRMLTELQTRTLTMPIVLLDSILPGQEISFTSAAQNFDEMIKYALGSNSAEIGIIGFNPIDGTPLNRGVTAGLNKDQLTFAISSKSQGAIAISVRGNRSFEVVGEPWMDETQSFYLANVEITDGRKEILSEDLEQRAAELHARIPDQVDKFVEWMVKREQLNPDALKKYLKDIGPMPDCLRKRAMWVGALVNPIPALPEVCPEIRPAMLACRNDNDRLVLASTALQSSIDRLSGKQ